MERCLIVYRLRLHVGLCLVLGVLITPTGGPRCALAGEQPQDLAALIAELTGEAPTRARTAAQWVAVYDRVVTALLPGIGAARVQDRAAAQTTLERICLYAGRPGADLQRAALSHVIAGHLAPELPPPAKTWLLRQLQHIGRSECVDAVAALLSDPDPHVREAARRALQHNPAPLAGARLRLALRAARDPDWQVALLEALGARRELESTLDLLDAAESDDIRVASAALSALGELAEPFCNAAETVSPRHRQLLDLVDTLLALREQAAHARRPTPANPATRPTSAPDLASISLADAVTTTLLRYAEAMTRPAFIDRALVIDHAVYEDPATPLPQRAAALAGIVRIDPRGARPLLTDLLLANPPDPLTPTAVRCLRVLPARQAYTLATLVLFASPPPTQAQLAAVLADLDNPDASSALVSLLDSDEPTVRLAALDALRQLGDPAQIVSLARHAATTTGPERDAARTALARVRGADADRRILTAALEQDDPRVAAELILSLGPRLARETIPALLELIGAPAAAGQRDDDPHARHARPARPLIRAAAWKSLAALAGPQHLSAMLGALLRESDPSVRQAAENTIVRVASGLDRPVARVQPVVGAMRKADATARVALVRILARLGGVAALQAVRARLADDHLAVREAALHALAGWKTHDAMRDLLWLARGQFPPGPQPDADTRRAWRIVALRGYLRLARSFATQVPQHRLRRLLDGLEPARQLDQMSAWLSALGTVADPAALDVALKLLARVAEPSSEAGLAIIAIADAVAPADRTRAVAALGEVLATDGLPEPLLDRARETLDRIERHAADLTRWDYAGPYACDGCNAERLFDVPFAPEPGGPGGPVRWRVLTARGRDDPWVFDFTQISREPHRCIYVRTRLVIPDRRDVVLHLGSDDGVKVWLNGRLVHSKLAFRPVRPGEDTVPLTLEAGPNELLLKIVQGYGGWGFACSLTDRAGRPMDDVRVDLPADADAPGLLLRVYDIGRTLHALPELPRDQRPNFVRAVAVPDLAGGFGEFLPLADQFVSELVGDLWVDRPGNYGFELRSDDGAKLWIDGRLVIDHDGLHGATPRRGEITLAPGPHRLYVRHFEAWGGEQLTLLWRRPDAEPQDFRQIPPENCTWPLTVPRETQPGRKSVLSHLRAGLPGDARPVAGPHPALRPAAAEPGDAFTSGLDARVRIAQPAPSLPAYAIPADDPLAGPVVLGLDCDAPTVWLPPPQGPSALLGPAAITLEGYGPMLLVARPASGEVYRIQPLRNGGCVMRFSTLGQRGFTRIGTTAATRKFGVFTDGQITAVFAPSGQTAFELRSVEPRSDGLSLKFTRPLDPRVGWEPDAYHVELWPLDPRDDQAPPARPGRVLTVRHASVSADRTGVDLSIPDLTAPAVVYLRLLPPYLDEDLDTPWTTQAWLTVHALPASEPVTRREPPPEPPQNVLTPQERAEGWTLLFDGKTTRGWRGFRKDAMPAGWQVVRGALVRVAPAGDIITQEQFDDFELRFQWRISLGGNSGVFYHVSEDEPYVWRTGPEYQILDNRLHPDGQNPLTSAAACYALYAPVRDVTRPVGLWNDARIVVRGGHVEHWLNGVKVVEYDLGSDDFRSRVAHSKFATMPKFAAYRRGHIALQDHGDKVWYRNIRIRRLR